MNDVNLNRRKILAAMGVLGMGAAAGPMLSACSSSADTSNGKLPRLIIFELFGGNDNLNTLVPYKESIYRAYRPNIRLDPAHYTPLNDDVALNKALYPLMSAWEAGDLAVIQDVGYPDSILSHFEAIKTMETTLSRDGVGWLARMISENPSLQDRSKWDLDAVWAGGHMHGLSGTDIIPFSPSSGPFSKYLKAYNLHDAKSSEHILGRTISGYQEMSDKLKGRVPAVSRFQDRFTFFNLANQAVGSQCMNIMRFIEGGIHAPVFKIGMSGFDLHGEIRGSHEGVLDIAARNVANLRRSLIEIDEWDNTLMLVFSEFGRRPKENASKGTDHGTCGPMFLLGGKVSGGVKGTRTNLEDLDANGNLKFTTDYRSVFSSVTSNWFNAEVNSLKTEGFLPLDNIFS